MMSLSQGAAVEVPVYILRYLHMLCVNNWNPLSGQRPSQVFLHHFFLILFLFSASVTFLANSKSLKNIKNIRKWTKK